MKPLGGFFELETTPDGAHYHPGALVLTSGRAGFALLLRELRPRRVHIPFYCCDALISPLREQGVPFAFYGLDEALEPLETLSPAGGDLVVYVDYFGLKGRCLDSLWGRLGDSLIADLVQAFFARPAAGRRAFNSARKWFGVPDGAYLYGAAGPQPPEHNRDVRWDHLLNRLLGRQDLAFRQFQESERGVDSRCLGMSLLSERLLAGIDYSAVAAARRRNFGIYEEALGPRNVLRLPRAPGAVPFCYPFLPDPPIDRRQLHEQLVFVPSLWPEVVEREGEGFSLERRLAASLLPLPVDHRLGAEDTRRVVELLSKGPE